jgi:hypothetical protein
MTACFQSSALSLKKDGPIVGVGRGRRVPNRAVDGRKVDLLPYHCTKPKRAVAARLKFYADLTTLQQIDGVGLAGFVLSTKRHVHDTSDMPDG